MWFLWCFCWIAVFCFPRALLAIVVVYLVVSRYLLQRAAAGPAADGEIDGLAITLYTPRQIDQIAYDAGMLECDCVRGNVGISLDLFARISQLCLPRTLRGPRPTWCPCMTHPC